MLLVVASGSRRRVIMEEQGKSYGCLHDIKTKAMLHLYEELVRSLLGPHILEVCFGFSFDGCLFVNLHGCIGYRFSILVV